MIFKLKKYFRAIPDTQYNDKLIKKLNKEHQKLIRIFLKLEKLVENEKKFISYLEKFLKELQLHLTLENHKLYTHIEKKYRFCFCYIEKIKELKEEIPNNIHLFNSLKNAVKNKDIDKAKEILDIIKAFLIKRIEFEEEKLYKIYLHTKKCEEIKIILNKTP